MFKKTTYTSDLEILVTEKNLVTFSDTVLSSGVVADADGRKYVPSGSFIDATGAIVAQTGTEGAETLSATPVGVLYKTVDVTNGNEAGAFIVEGYLRADRVLAPFATAAVTLLKAALPNIKFR